MKDLKCTRVQPSYFRFLWHHQDVKLRISMETAGLIIGNSLDGSVLSGDLSEIQRICLSAFIWNRGASIHRKSDHLAAQPAAPWCPTNPQRAGEDSRYHPLQVRPLSLSCIHILFCTTKMMQQGLTHTVQGLLLSWPPVGHSWSERSHSMEQRNRFEPYVPIWMEAQVALPIRHLLMQPVCCQGGKQR